MASFTNVNDTLELFVPAKGETIAVAISGTYDQVIELQRELGSRGSGAWVSIKTFDTEDATEAFDYVSLRDEENIRLFLRTDAGGTATVTLTDTTDLTQHVIRDKVGNVLATFRQAGVTLEGVTIYSTLNDGTTALGATALELNANCDTSARMVAGGSTLTLTQALHDGRTVLFDTASGSVLTLPAATGTGMKIRCLVSVTATTNAHVAVCAGSDELLGTFLQTQISDDSVKQYEAATGDSFVKVTWNRSTTGLAIIGDHVEFQDVASALWAVHGAGRASGSIATPFST